MDEQASAELYPDQEAKKDGAFSKFGAVVKKAAADRQAAKDELSRQYEADAQAAGALVTSGVFGTSTVEIYQGGYVRVATGKADATRTSSMTNRFATSMGDATRPASITRDTPYEKLRSIKFTQPGQDQTSGGTSGMEDALGPAVASLMKGGRALMKSSVPGLAVAGITHFVTNEARKPFLTIATDKTIHTLTQTSSGLLGKGSKGHNEVGLVLEVAGNSVLGVVAEAAHEPEPEPQPVVVSYAAKAPTLAEKLRELADLHRDGILSDEEFAAAKGKLLSGI